MAEYLIQDTTLISIGDAIRAKTGKTDAIPVSNLASEIAAISSSSASGALDFVVVGGTTQPSNPSKNTIWVNTDIEITRWGLGMTNPYLDNKFESEELYTTVNATELRYLDSSGNLVSSDGTYPLLTDYIQLPVGTFEISVVEGSTSSSVVYHGFYDSNNALVSVVQRGAGTKTYTVPNGAVSFRMSVRTDNASPSIIARYYDVENGDIWIQTGVNKNSGSFDAVTEENIITINPMSCWQYVDRAWTTKTAKSYINGAWTGWYTYLYNQGDQCTDLTGGWESQKDNSKTTPKAPALSFGETTMTASIYHNGMSNYWGGVVRTKNGIDLTNYSKLTCVTTYADGYQYLMIDEVDQTGFEVYVSRTTLSSAGSYSIDLSGISGIYDVMIYIYNNSGGWTSQATVSQIYLE